MEGLVLYHRSFVDVSSKATTKHNMWIGEQTYERVPMHGSIPGYQWLSKEIKPVDLYAKPNQNFSLYATRWEDNCSTLLNSPRGGSIVLQPVVDEHETQAGFPVIGHYGIVSGEHIIIPREYVKANIHFDLNSLRDLLEQGVPAFVTSQKYANAGGWSSMERTSIARFSVMTDLEGKVIAELGARYKDDSIVSVDPTAILMVGQLAVALGKGVIQSGVNALIRANAARETRAVIKTLQREMAEWGVLQANKASIQGLTRAELVKIKATMERAMGNLIDPGTNTIRAASIRQLDQTLRREGFTLSQVQNFGPAGGHQLFYRNGNVMARIKTRGDGGGPRAGVPHASFSLVDGWGLRWEHDILKFTKSGGFAPKNIVSLETWTANNMAKSQNIGSRNFWYAVKKGHTQQMGDAWANSTHFNATPTFSLEGVEDIIRGVSR